MGRRFQVCCLTKNKSNPAYVGAQIAAGRLADRLGCTLEGFAPETPDDIDQQRDLLDRAIDSGPDAILIAPVHVTALDDSLRRAKDAGIRLVFFVAASEGVAADSFVTSDNHALAVAAARHLFDTLGGQGRIGIIEGSAQSPTSAPRTTGFLDAAARYPGITVDVTDTGHYQRPQGYEAMRRILAAGRHLNGLLVANDAMALGAIDALDEAGLSIPVVGMNAMPEAITAIRAGRMLATVSFDAPALVCTALMAALRLLQGEDVPAVVELPAEVIARHNCAAWHRPYEDRPLPDWTALG